MELHIFMRELKSALVVRGIPEETAARHVSNLSRSFTSDDLSEIDAIESQDEIEQLADSISVILAKGVKKAPAPSHPQSEYSESNESKEVIVKPNVQESHHPAPKARHQAEENRYFEYSPENSPSTKGMLIFWLGLFFTSPITLALAAVLFGTFGGIFIGLAGLIVCGIITLIATVAVGAGVSLVGIIFGITQLFTFKAAGIYEIGLGVMIAGAVLFVSVLIYNISIRFFPWLITLVGNFLGFLCKKIKDLFLHIRRECYKL